MRLAEVTGRQQTAAATVMDALETLEASLIVAWSKDQCSAVGQQLEALGERAKVYCCLGDLSAAER